MVVCSLLKHFRLYGCDNFRVFQIKKKPRAQHNLIEFILTAISHYYTMCYTNRASFPHLHAIVSRLEAVVPIYVAKSICYGGLEYSDLLMLLMSR